MLRTRRYPFNTSRTLVSSQVISVSVIFFLLLHIPLAFLMRQSGLLATLHALVTLGLGFFWAVQGKTERVILTVGYIAGSEVLWRMADANVFWEFGKYATVFILLISILHNRKLNPPVAMFFYFVLLLPSMLLTLTELPLGQARQFLSYNLSGPLAILVCTWFFSERQIDLPWLKKMILVTVSPLLTMVTIAWLEIFSAGIIEFTASSNFGTSGGYGPNQVSSILGMGMLLIFSALIVGGDKLNVRIILIGLFSVFLTESLLTFSRSGAYLAGLSILGTILFWLRKAKDRVRILFLSAFVIAIFVWIIFPYLESFTGGVFSERFTDVDLTGRDSIVMADLMIWQENFFFGVGPGMATEYRTGYSVIGSAHTEFTRMLSEHGLFGLAALIIFFIVTLKQVIREINNKNGALKLGIWAFATAYMTVNAMRVVAPAFMLGLLFASLNIAKLQTVGESKKTLRRRLK